MMFAAFTWNVYHAHCLYQMAILISQQDEQIASIETKAIGGEEDIRKG